VCRRASPRAAHTTRGHLAQGDIARAERARATPAPAAGGGGSPAAGGGGSPAAADGTGTGHVAAHLNSLATLNVSRGATGDALLARAARSAASAAVLPPAAARCASRCSALPCTVLRLTLRCAALCCAVLRHAADEEVELAPAAGADVLPAPMACCDIQAEEVSNLVAHKWWTQVCVCVCVCVCACGWGHAFF
jgi:hypothetical protein